MTDEELIARASAAALTLLHAGAGGIGGGVEGRLGVGSGDSEVFLHGEASETGAELVQHFADAQILGAADGFREILPELA